jgi:hypothetical protein
VGPDFARFRRPFLAYVGALFVAALLWEVGIAFVHVAIQHHATSAFAASAAWGLLLLASFAGWGTALNVLLFPRDRADWGLRCAWGWGVVMTLGGTLCALQLAVRRVLVTVVAIGLVCLGVGLVRSYRAWSRRNVRRWWRMAWSEATFALGAAAVFAVSLVAYLASIVDGNFNGNDDTLCYFAFAREILDRGTLSQPFSLRRIAVYGGQSLLHAFQIAIPVPDTHLHLLDTGMALLAVMALLVGHVSLARRTSRAVVLLALLLTATLPDVRRNIGSTMTGVVFFLGLYRTLVWRPVREGRPLRAGVPVALLGAGACALRQNYLAMIGIFLALEYGVPIVRGVQLRPWRAERAPIVRAAVTAGLLVLFLLPWWAMSLRWCASFLFPVAPGHYNPDYDYFRPLPLFDNLRFIWANACYCFPVRAVPFFLVALLTCLDRAKYRTLMHFSLATFAGFALLIKSFADFEPHELGRYYFGFTFAALLAIALAVAESQGRRIGRASVLADRAAGVPLVLIAMALQIYSDRDETKKTFDRALTAIQPAVESPTPWEAPGPDPAYAQLQAAIPAGAPIAVLVDQFGRFDLQRNQVESLDIVGAISPPPGLPLFQGADAVADYLVALGYRYAIVVHPDASGYLYRRDTWARLPADALAVWKRTARFYLQAFDDFDALRETRVHLADTAGMTTLDLTQRSAR